MFQASDIIPAEKIFSHLKEIQDFLEADYSSDIPANCIDRLDQLQSYMALSGKLLADAEWHYQTLLNSEIIKVVKEMSNLTASTLNKYIESMCKEYKYLVTFSDRINRATVHQIDSVRSILSYQKIQATL